MRKARTALAVTSAMALVAIGGVAAIAATDAGQAHEDQLEAHSNQYFGVTAGLAASSTRDISAAQATANPLALATLAKGLSATVVTSGQAAPNLDMGTLWPVDDPQWIISCNEQGTTNPGPAPHVIPNEPILDLGEDEGPAAPAVQAAAPAVPCRPAAASARTLFTAQSQSSPSSRHSPRVRAPAGAPG